MTAVAPVPVDSATVILIREAPSGEVDVLLVARHAKSRAFAGAHVFPGGVVDAADAEPALVGAVSPGLSADSAVAALGEDVRPEVALSFYVAAIRELFEEAGVLLATIDGVPLSFADPLTQVRFASHRRALLDGNLTFAELVTSERLVLQTDGLHCFSRWITPVSAPRRYDARFFAARVPVGQVPLHDSRETTAAEWLAPADALARAAAGALVLTPPTARTLEELQDLGSAERIFSSIRTRRIVPILPKVVQVGDRVAVLYPGDADYDRSEAGTPLPEATAGPLNRVVMEDGGWRRLRRPTA